MSLPRDDDTNPGGPCPRKLGKGACPNSLSDPDYYAHERLHRADDHERGYERHYPDGTGQSDRVFVGRTPDMALMR